MKNCPNFTAEAVPCSMKKLEQSVAITWQLTSDFNHLTSKSINIFYGKNSLTAAFLFASLGE